MHPGSRSGESANDPQGSIGGVVSAIPSILLSAGKFFSAISLCYHQRSEAIGHFQGI